MKTKRSSKTETRLLNTDGLGFRKMACHPGRCETPPAEAFKDHSRRAKRHAKKLPPGFTQGYFLKILGPTKRLFRIF